MKTKTNVKAGGKVLGGVMGKGGIGSLLGGIL